MPKIEKLSDRADALESFHVDQIKTREEFDLMDENLSVDADRMETVSRFNI